MPLDLRNTYLHLIGERRVNPVAVTPDFWPTIEENPHLHNHRMLMRFDFEGDWRTWEIHPEGDEVVVQLSGEMTLLLDVPGGPARQHLRAGEAAVIPRNTWHTADISAPCSALFLTHGRGTQNRPRTTTSPALSGGE